MNLRLYGSLLIVLALGCQKTPRTDTTGFIIDGLEVVFKRTPGRPLVAAGFYLRGGLSYGNPEQAGLEPLLLATMMEGTLRLDEVHSRLDAFSATLEVVAEHDYSGLTISFPIEHWPAAWELLSDILLHPRLDPVDLERVRDRIISSRITAPTGPEQDAALNANQLYYSRHHYSRHPWGSLESLSRLKRRDLVQYYRGDVTKNRALLVVVGDLDLEELTSHTRRLAKQLPLGPDMLPPALTFDPGKSALKVSRRSLSREHITGLFGAPRPGHPDFPAFTVALILLEDLLYDELHTSRQLAYHPMARAGDRFFNYGLISLSSARPREALQVVFEVLERLTVNLLPVTVLQGRIAVALTRHHRRLAGAAGARDRLAHWKIVGESWEQLDQFAPELQTVRPEQVQFVMRKYVRNIHFAVVGNPRKVPRKLLTSR